jgi:hypothetical protein
MNLELYKYEDPDGEVVLSRDAILDLYYPWWSRRMLEIGKLLMITEQNCIEDWVISNYAVRIK